MRSSRVITGLVAVVLTSPSGAQTARVLRPGDFWSVAATTIPVPPALAQGVAGSFWNPSQRELEPGLVVVHAELVETPPEVGLTAVLGGVSTDAPYLGRLTLAFGRVAVGDLVRTSTNPTVREGGIEVYSQCIGVGWSRTVAEVRVGATARLLTNRLDDRSTSDWALDLGAGYDLTPWLRVAAATQFFAPWAGGAEEAVFYTGAEALAWRTRLGDLPAGLALRAGTASIGAIGTDLIVGAGFTLGGAVTADLAAVDEASQGTRDWRAKIGVGARVGRYRVAAAWASGVGELGAAYRIGLEATLR